jgi:hypothetical protein
MRDTVFHAHEHRKHRNERECVDPEAPRLADPRHDQPRDCGTEHARGIECGRVQRDRIRQILDPDHLDEERLPSGEIERADRAEHEREHEHHPGLDHGEAHEQREQHRLDERQRLREEDELAFVDAIDDRARPEREQHDRQELGEAEQAEHERRVREPVHEPTLRHALHPRADQRNDLSQPEQPEVAMAKRAKAGTQNRAGGRGRHGRSHASIRLLAAPTSDPWRRERGRHGVVTVIVTSASRTLDREGTENAAARFGRRRMMRRESKSFVTRRGRTWISRW